MDFDWLSTNADVVQTVYAAARVALIPKTLDWNLGLSPGVTGNGESWNSRP